MTRKHLTWRFCLVLGLLALARSEQAHATLITFAYTAEVTFVSDDGGFLNGQVSVGDGWNGSFTFDASWLDSYPADPTRGEYIGAMTDNRGGVGGITYATTPGFENTIEIANGFLGLFDRCFYSAQTTIGGEDISYFAVLTDYQSTALNDDALPLVPPDLAPFETRHIEVHSETMGVNVAGDITSLVVVPEPEGAVALVVLACCLTLPSRGRVA